MKASSNSAAPLLTAIREKMAVSAVAALIVPTSDAHNSEYVAPHLQRRAFLTNFQGSAGTAVVTMDKALLWTDGRYWLQAEDTKYPEFELMMQGKPDVLSVEDWVDDQLPASAAIGMDPHVCTVAEWERMKKKIHLTPVSDVVAESMPPESGTVAPIVVRPATYCGSTVAERRAAIVEKLAKQHCDFIVLSALDEIAWLTNLRGRDVPHNPVFYAYAVVDKDVDKVRVYVNLSKVTDEVRAATSADIDFCAYEQLEADLLADSAGRTVLVDEYQTSEAVHRILIEGGALVKRCCCGPAQQLKALKNPVELAGFRACHERDGAALTRFLAWLQEEIAIKGVTTLNEFDAATRLQQFRAEDDKFLQLSFETISAAGPNGAMCHYAPAATDSAIIRRDQLYLVDSGAQYHDGTTDVTRTVCFDAPTEQEKEAYTLVLKGHIALNSVIFPRGVTGHRLDVLARHALWQVGLDYAHGTGHGVGSCLNVHEGPHGVGIRPTPTNATMDEHFVVTNEPGYYKAGHYGIRIENLEEIVAKPTKYGGDGFLGLSHITMAPLHRDLINTSMLTAAEIEWVNAYHARVKKALVPLLEAKKDTSALAYLNRHTEKI